MHQLLSPSIPMMEDEVFSNSNPSNNSFKHKGY